MKKFAVLFMGLFIFAAVNVNAQAPGADYFAGTWNILLKGTPNGDVKMIFKIDKNGDALSGAVQDSTGTEISKMTSLEIKDGVLNAGFTAQGYDVTVTLNKKDDDHVSGSLMGMFDVDGERKK